MGGGNNGRWFLFGDGNEFLLSLVNDGMKGRALRKLRTPRNRYNVLVEFCLLVLEKTTDAQEKKSTETWHYTVNRDDEVDFSCWTIYLGKISHWSRVSILLLVIILSGTFPGAQQEIEYHLIQLLNGRKKKELENNWPIFVLISSLLLMVHCVWLVVHRRIQNIDSRSRIKQDMKWKV